MPVLNETSPSIGRMCALLSNIPSTPYRTSKLPPSRSSYLSDFNILNNRNSITPSPSRRIHSMQHKPPSEADTNFHKDQAQAHINVSRVKFSLLILALMAVVAILFTFLALQSLTLIEWRSTTDESFGFGDVAVMYSAVWELASSLSLIAVTTSISTFLLSTLQLFFALKMLKTNPTSVKSVLSFLKGGRFLRCIVYTVWFFAVLFFIFGVVLHWMLVPRKVGFISKGVGAVFGIASTALCGVSLIHCIYVWCFITNKEGKVNYLSGNLSTLV